MSREKQAAFTDRDRKAGEPMILPATVVGGEVGTFYMDFVLWNLQMDRSFPLSGLVDTGATYPQVPQHILEELGVERSDTVRFRLADGSSTELSLGHIFLEIQGRLRPVSVIFGSESSSVLLGALALEAFGLAADVSNQRLVPADVLL